MGVCCRPSVRRFVTVLGFCLPLAAVLAGSPAAAETTADSVAFGQRVDLTLVRPIGNLEVESGPSPFAGGFAPPAYDLSSGLPFLRFRVERLGDVLITGGMSAAAGSQSPAVDDADAAATLNDVALDLGGRLTLTARTIDAAVGVVPEDGFSCWDGTASAGETVLTAAVLGGTLLPTRIELPALPEPNHVALDMPGVVRVIVNEQSQADGRRSVHAVHVEVISLTIPEVGTLRGDVYLGHADAAVGCGGADVGVAVADSADPGSVEGTITYIATVTNAGPERADETELSMPLPDSLDPVAAVPSQGSCSIAGRTVLCALGSVRADHEAAVAVTVQARHSGAVLVTADARSSNDDAWFENDHDSEATLVHGRSTFNSADLSMAIVESADPVWVFDPLVYTLTVRNDGNVGVPDVLVIDELPVGVELISVVPSKGECGGTRTVVCDVGDLAVGEEEQVAITVLVLRGGTIANTATVSSSTTDPTLPNNLDNENTMTLDLPSMQ